MLIEGDPHISAWLIVFYDRGGVLLKRAAEIPPVRARAE